MMIARVITACIAVALSSSALAEGETCGQDLHRQKYERFAPPDVPSLLEACGLGDLLSGFLNFDFSFDVPELGDLFCGYGVTDIVSWYDSGGNMPANMGGSFGVGINTGADGVGIDWEWGSSASGSSGSVGSGRASDAWDDPSPPPGRDATQPVQPPEKVESWSITEAFGN